MGCLARSETLLESHPVKLFISVLQMPPDWSTTRAAVENCLLSALVQCLFYKRRSLIKCSALLFIRRIFFLPVAVTVGYSPIHETLYGAKVLSGNFVGILKYTLEMQTSHETIAVPLQKWRFGETSDMPSNKDTVNLHSMCSKCHSIVSMLCVGMCPKIVLKKITSFLFKFKEW